LTHTVAGLVDTDEADNLWSFQRNLAIIVAVLTGADNNHNPFNVIQFDEMGA
jgi:hypothetical protein